MVSTMALEDQRAYYPEIKKRTLLVHVLLVHGEKDGPVSVNTSKWAYDNLGGEKKLVIYENVGMFQTRKRLTGTWLLSSMGFDRKVITAFVF
jgi:hypothetical protein